MRPRLVLVAAAAIVALGSAPARGADGDWAELARRIAGADPSAQLRVTAGAEPPGFVFPLPARPALTVVGSTWFASQKNAPPEIAHVYYAPTAQTPRVAETLYAQLAAAGYTRLSDPSYEPAFSHGEFGPARHMCPADLRRPAVDVRIENVGGLPAMDVELHLDAESTPCRTGAVAPIVSAHAAKLTDIPGVAFRSRMSTVGTISHSPYSTATVRTVLPASDAVAKIAERFVAKGWTPRPAAVTDRTITQRFELVEGAVRLDALLVFDRRAAGVYDVLIAVIDSMSQRSVR
jgi:hypothetical protein